jgi:hypothetical protein
MKLYATLKNERQGKKSTGDDTRILIELSYKNKIIGTIGLYAIIDDKIEGYRMLLDDEVIREEEYTKGKTQTDKVCYCDEAGLSAPHLQSDH